VEFALSVESSHDFQVSGPPGEKRTFFIRCFFSPLDVSQFSSRRIAGFPLPRLPRASSRSFRPSNHWCSCCRVPAACSSFLPPYIEVGQAALCCCTRLPLPDLCCRWIISSPPRIRKQLAGKTHYAGGAPFTRPRLFAAPLGDPPEGCPTRSSQGNARTNVSTLPAGERGACAFCWSRQRGEQKHASIRSERGTSLAGGGVRPATGQLRGAQAALCTPRSTAGPGLAFRGVETPSSNSLLERG
jgi:hypothetical protein